MNQYFFEKIQHFKKQVEAETNFKKSKSQGPMMEVNISQMILISFVRNMK